jgi:hypothetical protein
MIRLHKKYLTPTVLLFIIEVLIALFINDKFIRPYFGDFLVVILIYCFVRSFLNVSVIKAALGTLIFSYLIETSQYFGLARHLGLSNSRLANAILGSSFEWTDIIAYTLGIATVIIIERIKNK